MPGAALVARGGVHWRIRHRPRGAERKVRGARCGGPHSARRVRVPERRCGHGQARGAVRGDVVPLGAPQARGRPRGRVLECKAGGACRGALDVRGGASGAVGANGAGERVLPRTTRRTSFRRPFRRRITTCAQRAGRGAGGRCVRPCAAGGAGRSAAGSRCSARGTRLATGHVWHVLVMPSGAGPAVCGANRAGNKVRAHAARHGGARRCVNGCPKAGAALAARARGRQNIPRRAGGSAQRARGH